MMIALTVDADSEDIRWALKERNMNQEDLGNHLGVTRTAVCNWLIGRRAMPADKFMEACRFLEIDPKASLRGGGKRW